MNKAVKDCIRNGQVDDRCMPVFNYDAYLCKDPKEKGYEEELMWKISTPPPNIRYIELNSETFADALLEVIR